MEQRTCGKCDRYSRSLLRCKESKANPTTKKGTHSAAEVMGWNYICGFSKWKQRELKRIAMLCIHPTGSFKP